jgi:hypothetical protein
MPCQNTYRSLLALLDAEAGQPGPGRLFHTRLSASVVVETNRADCSSRKDARTKLILLSMARRSGPRPVPRNLCIGASFYEVQTGLVLLHCQVRAKQNEISALKPLLTPPLVTERILTVDAMHTQRECCRRVRELHGDDVVIAKDHQPGLRTDLEDFFEDPQADRQSGPRDEQVETRARTAGAASDLGEPR